MENDRVQNRDDSSIYSTAPCLDADGGMVRTEGDRRAIRITADLLVFGVALERHVSARVKSLRHR